MATRKREETELEQPDMLDGVFNAESLNPALETLYAELGLTDGGDATVHVTKLADDGRGQEAHVWRGDPDNYDLEQIAKQFGSGNYRTKIYVRIATGQKVCKANKVQAWLLSPDDEMKRHVKMNPVAPAQRLQSELNPLDIAKAVAEAIKATMPAPVPQVDPMQQMRNMTEIMCMMQPIVAQPAMNPLSMMRDMAETMNALRGEVEPIERRSNANGNDLMLALINKFAPLFEKVIMPGMGGMSQVAADQPVQLQAPMENPQPVQQPAEDDVSVKLKMGLSFLLQQKEAGGSPETYAEVVLDSVPEDALEQLLKTTDPVGYLAAFDARISEPANKEWFQALINEIKEVLKDDDENEGSADAVVS